MNGCAPSLALIERLRSTRKWVIAWDSTVVSTKVVSQQRKSVHDNTDWYYGL